MKQSRIQDSSSEHASWVLELSEQLRIAQVHHGAPITMSPALSGPAQVCTAVTQGEIERLNEEISGLREKLERFQVRLNTNMAT